MFVISVKRFKEMLSSIVSEDSEIMIDFDKRDFGVLMYNTEDEKIYLHASLTPAKLALEEVDLDDYKHIDLKKFILFTNSILSIKEGEIDDHHGLCRWSREITKDKNDYRMMLMKIFQNVSGHILHYVLIKSNNYNHENVKECLFSLVSDFRDKKNELSIDDIWLYERLDNICNVWDGRFRGKLNINQDYNFVLGIEFSDDTALKKYYSHVYHSEKRESLYCAINPKICESYQKIKTLNNSSLEIDIFEKEIEDAIKPYLLRLDIELSDLIENVLSKPGIKFSFRY